MNVVVKKGWVATKTRRSYKLISSIFEDSQSFIMVEDNDDESKSRINLSIRKKTNPSNLSQALNKMANMNCASNTSRILVETSIITNGMVIKEEVDPTEREDIKLALVNRKNLLIGIFILLVFVISGSALGPATLHIPAKSILIKTLWRTETNLMFSFPLMILVYVLSHFKLYDNISLCRDFSPRVLMNSMITSFFSTIWFIGLVIGCSMTISSHAMTMYSSTGVFIFIITAILGTTIHTYEFFGFGFYFAGVFMLLTDPHALKISETEHYLAGDFISFISAGSGAILAFINSNNVIMLMTQVLIFSCIFQIFIAILIYSPVRVLSSDPGYGMFGWIKDRNTFWFLILFSAPFTGVLNYMSFYLSFTYWPMQIIACALVAQPFISQAYGIYFEQDKIPGIRTFFGLVVITTGTLLATYGARVKAIERVEEICKEYNLSTKIHMSIISGMEISL